MTSEDVKQEIEREPYVPLRLHLASGKVMDVPFPGSAFLRQNTLVIMHRLTAHTQEIGGYDVIALRLIERIELVPQLASA
jgi:hypothetical protein